MKTSDVICYGKRQNHKLLKHLKSLGFHFYDGREIYPNQIEFTGHVLDEEDSVIQTASYAIDYTLLMVAFHDSMLLLQLYQAGKKLIGWEEYVESVIK